MPFCSPVSPGESETGSNGADQLSRCSTFSRLLSLCASNVRSYFVVLCCFISAFVRVFCLSGGEYTVNAGALTQTEKCGLHEGSDQNKKRLANRPCLSFHNPDDPSLLGTANGMSEWGFSQV